MVRFVTEKRSELLRHRPIKVFAKIRRAVPGGNDKKDEGVRPHAARGAGCQRMPPAMCNAKAYAFGRARCRESFGIDLARFR